VAQLARRHGRRGRRRLHQGVCREKLANAEHEGDKRRIRNERKRFLQQLSAIVARRNYAIFHNASPRRGGEAPPAPPIDFE
jgi:hypothetical protein